MTILGKIRHWWRNIKWLQRFRDWRYANIPIVFGRWSIWSRGELILRRLYWRGWWTPIVRVKQRYPYPFE